MNSPIIPDAAEIDAALADFDSFQREIAYQRFRLRQVWKEEAAKVDQVEGRLNALETTLAHRSSALIEFLEANPTFRYAPSPISVHWVDPDSVVVRNNRGAWTVSQAIETRLDIYLRAAQSAISEGGKKSREQRASNGAARDLLDEYRRDLAMLKGVQDVVKRERVEVLEAQVLATRAARIESNTSLAVESTRARNLHLRLPPVMQPWSSAIWGDDWARFSRIDWPSQVFAGTLTPMVDAELEQNSDFGVTASLPLFINPGGNLQLLYDSSNRDATLALVRSLLLRSLVAIQPGGVNFCFFDPAGSGASMAGLLELGDFDPALIGGKVWASPSEISDRLEEQLAHTASLEQKYLRSKYSSIDEFNLAAGEIVEKSRLMVLLDFPAGFNEELHAALRRLLETGPRCGVRTILVSNLEARMPLGVSLTTSTTRIHRIVMSAPFSLEHHGYSLEMSFSPDSDGLLRDGLMRDIITTVGVTASARQEGRADPIRAGMRTAPPRGKTWASG